MKPQYFAVVTLFAMLAFASPACATTPTVSSTTPAASAANVALNTTISVVFNTAMTANTLTTSSFYIMDSLGNQVAVNSPGPVPSPDKMTFTITPTANLAPCQTYNIFVTTTVKSLDTGTKMSDQFSQSFTTVSDAAAPTVTSKVPATGATGVIEFSPVTVTFDKMMNPATINATTFGLDKGATGNITLSSAGNVTTAIFTPLSNLVSSTLYTATVGAGAWSSCNVALAAPYSWSFTVRDTAAPYITSKVPTAGAVNIARTSPITINFSVAMQALTTSNITVTDGVTPVTGTVTFDAVSKLTATFSPTGPMNFNTLYTVTVTGAKDLANNAMAPDPYSFSFTTVAQDVMQYCSIPPFVSTNIMQPNILLIMDNSNSMDERFDGAAVGSFSPNSKTVAGKTALQNIVQTYSNNMRIGLMTYSLPAASKQYIGNSPYFASYEPKSYCPYPPTVNGVDYCFDYCANGTSSSQTACHNGCVAQNSLFDETYMDEAITSRAIGNALRTKYCGLVYPKTREMVNPSDPTHFVYYKQALPFYTNDGNPPGNWFCYAAGYDPSNELTAALVGGCTAASCTSFNYACYTGTINTNDDSSNNNGNLIYNGPFGPTDSDLANGYGNFGRRLVSIQVGQTWFANSSPGGGYLQVAANSNDSVNTQMNLLLNKLATYSGNEAGYMSCTDTTTPNTCSYIVNAGLTPTAGTLQTASDYFTGASSPIQQRCQKNFIIYVTDGLPSVDSSGTAGVATTLIGDNTTPAAGTVLNKLDALHSISVTLNGKPYNFNVKTYILGLGLSPDDKAKLEMMAEHGGTSQAYYADNTTQLYNALASIFTDINAQLSSGTSASIVNNRGESGANLFQAVFYPKKTIGGTDINWVGELQNLWYYLDPLISVSSMREDTDFNDYLDLKADDRVTVDYDPNKSDTVVKWSTDTTGTGTFVDDATANARTPLGSTDNIRALWRAGALLHYRSAASRVIYSVLGSYNSKYLNASYAYPSTSLSGFTSLTTANESSIESYLNVPDPTTGTKVIKYIRGIDDPAYRSRAVSISYPSTNPAPLNADVPGSSVVDGVGIWKLGDIVSSTPQAMTSKQLQAFDMAYNDLSYSLFYNSNGYNLRNMVFAGANDGMLHAFRIGQVTRTAYNGSYPYRLARLNDLDASLNLGDEEWGFIPGNALPYLKYLADPAYNHLYYVNNTVSLVDVSINKTATGTTACTQAQYWKCDKLTTYSDPSTKTIDGDNTSWRSVLIGGMGLGGASRDSAGFCNLPDGTTPVNSAAETRFDCVKSQLSGKGLSSFFALDVTNPASPMFLWEFSDAVLPAADKGLGFATSGPAIVRISARSNPPDNYGTPNLSLNGRWFAVFATGPSGPIDTIAHQFMGRSDNRLKVYVVDIHPDLSSGWVKNTNYWVFDSGIYNAFAGDITNAVVDVDRWNSSANGYYSDDVVYIGYTRPNVAVTLSPDGAGGTTWPSKDVQAVTAGSTWSEGGVLRLLTNDSLNPADWTLSTMIDGVGPVTTAVTKLQDRKNGKLWTYFGSGRYFFKNGSGSDDASIQRYLLGVQDTCYNGVTNSMNSGFNQLGIKQGCGVTAPATLSLSDLEDQTTTIAAALSSGKKGWKIQLDAAGNYSFGSPGSPLVQAAYDAERVVTNTIANFNGVIFFTTFKPSTDVCSFGGTTLEWIVDYGNGGVPPASAMKGKLLIQLSGGEIVTVDVSTATKANNDATQTTHLDRRIRADQAGHGEGGGQSPNLQSPSQPVRKILHILEK